jgi:hypothetical protein
VFDLPDELPVMAVAASGPVSARIAAELGDGLFATEPGQDLVSSWHQLGGTGPAYAEMPPGTSFWGQLPGEVRRGPAQELVLLLQRLVPLPQLPQLRRLAAGHARPPAVLDVSELEPPVQARLRDGARAVCDWGIRDW